MSKHHIYTIFLFSFQTNFNFACPHHRPPSLLPDPTYPEILKAFSLEHTRNCARPISTLIIFFQIRDKSTDGNWVSFHLIHPTSREGMALIPRFWKLTAWKRAYQGLVATFFHCLYTLVYCLALGEANYEHKNIQVWNVEYSTCNWSRTCSTWFLIFSN